MKHKKLIVTIVAIVAMAIAAAVAYAWWSDTWTSDTNSLTTGSVDLEAGGLPIAATGLVPQTDPAMDAADGEYAAVKYFYVRNDSSIALMFYGWLSDGSDPAGLQDYVNIRVWLLGSSTAVPAYWTGYPGWTDTFQPAAGGPFLSYGGLLKNLWWGAPAGINYLSSRKWIDPNWYRTPIGSGEQGTYRVAVWLGSSAPDSTQGKTVSFKINFTGMQVQAWDEAGYDSNAFEDPFTP